MPIDLKNVRLGGRIDPNSHQGANQTMTRTFSLVNRPPAGQSTIRQRAPGPTIPEEQSVMNQSYLGITPIIAYERHQDLIAEADRARLISLAARTAPASRDRTAPLAVLRHRTGISLVRIGERIQGGCAAGALESAATTSPRLAR